MIIIKPVGGLASQLHKYAIGYTLAKKHNTKLKLDLSWFEDTPKSDTNWEFALNKFLLEYEIASESEIASLKPSKLLLKVKNVLSRFFGINIDIKGYVNNSFIGLNEFMNIPDNVYLEGEWVGYKYFCELKNELSELIIRKDIASLILDKYKIDRNVENVSLHIRRGDFISNPSASKFHKTCSLEYYYEAIDKLESIAGDKLKYFVFSDDIAWAKENLAIKNNMDVEFVTELDEVETFIFMTQCDHNIIANSGFSWFASWFNENHEKIVFAPKLWVSDEFINSEILAGISEPNVKFLNNE